jgi:hypothetical protein
MLNLSNRKSFASPSSLATEYLCRRKNEMLVNPAPMTTGHGYQYRPLKNGAADGATGRAVVVRAYNTGDS